MPSETHLTHVTLTDDEFRIVNVLIILGAASLRDTPLDSFVELGVHAQVLMNELGAEAFTDLISKFDKLGAANPNFKGRSIEI